MENSGRFSQMIRDRAEEIARLSLGRPILVFMSGGIDSEMVATAFRRARVPFIPAVVRYEKGYNDFDIGWAKRWCDGRKLDYLEFEAQLEKFILSKKYGLILKATGVRCPYNPGIFNAVQAAAQVGFTCVSGCTEPYIAIESGRIFEYQIEQAEGLPRWLAYCGLGAHYFEFFRTEVFREYFIESAKQLLRRGATELACEEVKAWIYKKSASLAPRPKLNGLEFLMAENAQVFERLHPGGHVPAERKIRVC